MREEAWWGCEGTISWKYNDSNDVILSFDTIWKDTVCRLPNVVKIKLKDGGLCEEGKARK